MKHNGLNCVNLVKKYLDRFHQLKPLVLVLKYMMYQLDLSDTYQGGLNSYGLILMIVSMLQVFQMQELLSQANLGSLLIRFFQIYGWEIDYSLIQISPTELEKHEKPIFDYKDEVKFFKAFPQTYDAQQLGPYAEKLAIIDPTNPGNNVGRCTYKINNIKVLKIIVFINYDMNINLTIIIISTIKPTHIYIETVPF